MKSGVVLVDKPAGYSSAQVIARVKKHLKLDKIGHAGTLDPMATGLLICLTGAATRLASYAEAGDKIYSGRIRLGLQTSTDDIEGEVLKRSDEIPPFESLLALSREFVGGIDQVPPRVSAIKVEGRRSYDLARAGSQHQLAARRVTIHRFDVRPESAEEVSFTIGCTKGTYIRSIARDLGERLGCGGCLSALRREGSHPFSVTAARTPEQLSGADIVDWSLLFPGTPRVQVEGDMEKRLLMGDQRVLHDFIHNIMQSAPGFSSAERAIYYSMGSGQSLGLVGKQDGRWTFLVNTPA